MPVQLLTQPDPFALTQGGRMVYALQADARLVSAGTLSQNWLYVQGPVPDGVRFTWRWASTSIELIARTTPTLPNEFPAGNGSVQHVEQLVAFFSSYYPFRKDFTATYYQDAFFGRGVKLTARQKGPTYAILSPALSTLNGVATGLAFLRQVGSDPVQRDRYGVLVELWVQATGATDFSLLDSRHIEADPSGLCQLDVGSVLHSYLSADLPTTTGGAASLSPKSVCSYYLAYAEAWGQPLQPGRVLTSLPRTALRGGADYFHRAGAGFPLAPYYSGVMPVTDRALRPGGSLTRYVLPSEPQYLTFLNGRINRADVSVEFGITLSSGTSLQIRRSLGPWALGSKLTLPVGFVQASLSIPGETVREYTVHLFLTGTIDMALSATYRYILDYAPRPWARFFLYQNSLGCPDTLCTYGKGSPELQLTSEQAERSLSSGYSVQDGQFVDYDVRLQQQLEVSTGFRPAGELQRWLDFYRSAERYMWLRTSMGELAVPISLISKSIRQAKDGENALAHLFQVALSYADSYSYDDESLLSEPLPPTGFAPQGSVSITQTTVVPVIDTRIPQAVLDLTPTDITKFRQAAARPNPVELGLLNQAVAESLFPTKAETITRDQQVDQQLTSLNASLLSRARIRARAIPTPQS